MRTRTLAAAAGTVALAAAGLPFVLAGSSSAAPDQTTQFADQHGPLGQID